MNYNPGSRFTTFKNTKLKLYSTLSKPKSNSSSLQHNTISTTSLNKSSNTSNNNNTFNFNKQTHISNLCLVMPVISTTRTSNSKNNNNNNNHHPQKPSFKRPPQQPLNQTYMSTIPYLNVSKRKGNLKPNQFKFINGSTRPNIIISNNNSKHINKSTNINFTNTNTSIISGYFNKSYRPIKLTLNTFNPNKNNKSISLNINHRHGHKQNNKYVYNGYYDSNESADSLEFDVNKKKLLLLGINNHNHNNNNHIKNNNDYIKIQSNTLTYNETREEDNSNKTSELINKYIKDCFESEKSNQGELSLDEVKDIIKYYSFKHMSRHQGNSIFTPNISEVYYDTKHKQYVNYFFK